MYTPSHYSTDLTFRTSYTRSVNCWIVHYLLHCYIPSFINKLYVYRTIKNIGGEKTSANYSILQLFVSFYNFYNIPYADRLQFAKVFSTKLPTVLILPKFLLIKYFTVRYSQGYETSKSKNVVKFHVHMYISPIFSCQVTYMVVCSKTIQSYDFEDKN